MSLILFHKICVDSSNIFKMEERINNTITVSNGRFIILQVVFRTQSNIYDSLF